MANLNRLFNVSISRKTRAATAAEFGVGILLTPAPCFYGLTASTFENATAASVSALVQVFSDYDSVVSAGVTGDTLDAANAYFAQSPQPETLVMADISSCYSKTAIRLTGSCTVEGKDAAIAFMPVGDPKSLYTATLSNGVWVGDASDVIHVSASDPDVWIVDGRVVWVDGAVIDVTASTVKPDSYAQAIAQIKVANSGWFMQFTPSRDVALLTQIADWTETQVDKMAALVDDVGTIYTNDKWPVGGITQYLYDKDFAGSFSICTKIADNFPDAALSGRCLTMAPGSETWALKSLSATQRDPFTETEYTTIAAIHGNTYEDYGSGVYATYPGTCGDGEAIEVVRFCYWQRDDMQKRLATMHINSDKIGHDAEGYEQECQTMEASLASGQRAGGISKDIADGDTFTPGYTVTRPTEKEVSAAQRIKGDIKIYFSFYLRYAIKHVDAIGDALTYGA
ncbi:DUF3383 domain-containing protein [Salmonella enterica subsp. enterica]|nr:hypothetical protein [Salmonella enterica subsp. enterica]ECK8239549.1 DUF3383 domain-containing protein [Salmonella enterica subsp. enterica serovar Agbeni]ECL0914712.1 DUF3383 domain-containing protein [Salmonella enterica subsp. enterica serovar Agbeni]EEC7144763.1 DUF3383 domain-containing protein [Salmonella enterica subsp. enterica]EIG0959543.1 DUF3383 family protein [Salmonella enterica subsp. enterica serovar Tudu]